ncbi:hypothetical protein VQ042_11665 [Aurantimonas sp. A2-1-M11]|uniref:hypothetical protein n=1 Tax=Aurantimonas sp. A2-1-M11 TaxID=3113712 RepID=UPI002F959797
MRENVNVTARKLGRTVRQVQARAGRIGAVKGEAPKREVCVDIALTSAEYDWFYSKADGLPISVFCRRILLAEYRKENP